MSNFTPTERTKVHRKPDRGSYERELIYSILDEAFVCQVGFISDGWPFVVPTNYVRVGDKLFLHGSTASRLMRTLSSGAPFCLNVTLLDGIVCAPTASGHSVNYRSVVVMGKAERVEVEAAKLAAMRDFVEYVIRGRWATVRAPSEQELKGTMVLAVPLVEAKSPDARPAQVFQGYADMVVPVDSVRQMIKDLRRAGVQPRYSEYHNAGHDVWLKAFAEPHLVPWLAAQKRGK